MTPSSHARDGRRAPCPVVALGASAGGLEAFKEFLRHAPADGGLTYVLVQHLSPEHKSSLQELLSHCTTMPVRVIANAMPVEANHVYVLPPNAVLTIENGTLRLSKPKHPHANRTPIDVFFRSLAEDQEENAACVVLSGAGSDGTLGLRAIKEHGGVAMAQAGESAMYDGMLRSAIATGLVDFVLPVEEIPGKLVDYFRHIVTVEQLKGPDGLQQEAESQISRICALLNNRTGHDFRQYKEGTLARRVQRRMQVRQIDTVARYIDLLRTDSHEIDSLFQDLLIGVTRFFRDPDAFKALETTIVPNLFEGRRPVDPVRVWVAGCATGEEAYSIAMLLKEEITRLGTPYKVQIFASDIDEKALEIARTGRYSATIAEDVPPKQLKRFFIREDGTYRVLEELREMCIFSMHDVLRDPPFSKLDLIACRNLLIYLKSDLQNRIIPLFHYALKPEGYLLLGSAENVTQHGKLFAAVDKGHRIFKRRNHSVQMLPHFPIASLAGRGDRAAPDGRAPAHRDPPATTIVTAVERLILDRYAPAYVIINQQQEVVRFSGRTGKYLEPAPGEPNTDIMTLARPGLRMDLRAAIHKALRDGRKIVQKNVSIRVNGGQQLIDLIVQPIHHEHGASRLYAVIFHDLGHFKPEPGEEADEAIPDIESANLQQLEAELRLTREQLQNTTEELESANEELKSSNEELLSMNEELQSTNEELETSKEELQSINEELQTVNAELSSRVEELARANNDLKNLLENTRIATLFLDDNLHIRNFTPAITDLFHIVESDTGRPVTDIKPRFSCPELENDLNRVRRMLSTIEREVQIAGGDAIYMMRLLPYRTVVNVIDGVVMTFVDVTRFKKIEGEARDSHARLNEILESISEAFYALDDQWRFTYVNRVVEKVFGRPRQELLGKVIWEELPAAIGTQFQEEHLRAAAERQPVHFETPSPVTDRWIEADISPGESGLSVYFRDITERKQANERQRTLLAELDHRVKNTLALCTSIAAQTMRTARSPEAFVSAFQRRLQAMAQAHALLTRNRWDRAPLRALIEAELTPFRDGTRGRVILDGPEVLLGPNATISLGMALHELATNAMKYGALSTPDGRVEVAWSLLGPSTDQSLRIRWLETGGPSVMPTAETGFGRKLIEKNLAYELDGTASLDFRPEGLRCVIEVPMKGNSHYAALDHSEKD